RRVPPAGEGGCGGGDGLLGMDRRGPATAADHFAAMRWIERIDGRRRRDALTAEYQRIGTTDGPGDLGQRRLHRLTNFRTAEVADRLIAERRRAGGSVLLRAFLTVPSDQRLFEWIHQQTLLGHVLGEAGPQEGLVSSVLEQAPDQVGHAGQELAIGRVDA